jgi:hypothetical protein
MSISPWSHCVGVDAFSFVNNYNASLLREGCARASACCTVRYSRHIQLLRFCGISNGPANSANNCNVSLPREGYARVAACCTVRRSWRRRLFRSYGVSDGLVNFANNCNASLPREGYARVAACCTVRRSRHRWLLCSCGVSDGMADFVRCLACRSLYKRLWRSRANFDMSWLNSARALICRTWFSKELVCSSFC